MTDTFPNATKNLTLANFESYEKFMTSGINSLSRSSDVNFSSAKDISKSYFYAVDKLLKSEDLNEFGQILRTSVKPISAEFVSYTLQFFDSNSRAQHEINDLFKARFDDSFSHFGELIDDFGKAIPVSVEPFFELFKTNITIWKGVVDELAIADSTLRENFQEQIDTHLSNLVSTEIIDGSEKTNLIEAEEVSEYAVDTEGGDIE